MTALGGPAVVLAVLYLLWSWRRAGGIGRLVAAVAIPLAWFALLPVVMREVSAGPIAGFSRGAEFGLLWLSLAGLVGALLPAPVGRAQQVPGYPRTGLRGPSRAALESRLQPVLGVVGFRLKAGLQHGAMHLRVGVPASAGPLFWGRFRS